MQPKVSVIVPVYNVEKYLRQCLDSLINQTLKDIEIICVDDGSTDHCPEILDEYAKLYAGVRVIHKNNTGYGDTMNTGLENATGEYIGIVESDDFAEPDMFESLYNIAIQNSADIVKSNFYFHTAKSGDNFHELLSGLPYSEPICPKDHKSVFFIMGSVWSGLYQKAFLQGNNITFNDTPGASYQDFSFSFKLWYCAKTVVFVKEAYLHYRFDNPMSSVRSPKKLHCIFDEYNEIERFVEAAVTKMTDFNAVLTKLKFVTCRDNYYRIAAPYQYYFLKLVSNDLHRLKIEDRYEPSLLTNFEENTIEAIMNDCDTYFEDTGKDFTDERLNFYHTLNPELYADGFCEKIKSSPKICIYGAGIVAQKVLRYLLNLGISKERILFVVTDPDTNAPDFACIPVRGIYEIVDAYKNDLFVVSLAEKNMLPVVQLLDRNGISNVILMENRLRWALQI